MKEATGELNMTIITVVAIAAIGMFLWAFLPGILAGISEQWAQGEKCVISVSPDGVTTWGTRDKTTGVCN